MARWAIVCATGDDMDIGATVTALEELRTLVNADGADLRIVGIDTRSGAIVLELDIKSAECGECVLPPDTLQDVIEAGLRQRCTGDYRVTIHDPRRAGPTAAKPNPTAVPAGLSIVDPGAELTTGSEDRGPDAGELAGRTVGFRVDVLWRSWDWVVDEWRRLLEREGASVTTWRRAQGLAGTEGQHHHDDYERFLGSIDVAIVGLANCGSCTSWTIKDAVAAASSGLPTVAVATAQFEALGRTLSAMYGAPGLRLHALPYPFDILPEQDVRAIARDHFPSLLDDLGARASSTSREPVEAARS